MVYFIGIIGEMKISNSVLTENLWEFSQQYLQAYQCRFNHLPIIEQDENWPSPCEQGEHLDKFTLWQPSKIEDKLTFDNVEQALELELHQDIKTYFTTMFCDTLDAKCDEGGLSLLFPWSEKDFKRLQENIIGHVLMKQKLKQRITIFFAVTDNEEHILSADNDTGEIWVERVGKEPHKKLANSMSEFIQLLTPSIPPASEG